jgi:hypothetical protein
VRGDAVSGVRTLPPVAGRRCGSASVIDSKVKGIVRLGAHRCAGSRVTMSEPTPICQQVAPEIRRAIADREVTPGERRPLAKDLATVLG